MVSGRSAPGLLTWPAWRALQESHAVLAHHLDPAWSQSLLDAEVPIRDLALQGVGDQGSADPDEALSLLAPAEAAGMLLQACDDAAAMGRHVVWFGSADGDPGLTDALAAHLARRAVAGPPPEVEMITGSYDLPGARLLDLVAVMDRLRSPGGCPWDAEQTHASLVPYLIEETHEVVEAVEDLQAATEGQDPDAGPETSPEISAARSHLAEELGDLLLQVVFHARIAQEHPSEPFDIDDVAAGIVAKLVRRHPHVFADVEADSADQVAANWEDIKDAEKAQRGSGADDQAPGPFDGIPASLPALVRAQKVLKRAERAGLAEQIGPLDEPVAQALLDAVRLAAHTGQDAETVLRGVVRGLTDTLSPQPPRADDDSVDQTEQVRSSGSPSQAR